jgi:hypothetical protein
VKTGMERDYYHIYNFCLDIDYKSKIQTWQQCESLKLSDKFDVDKFVFC